MEEGHGTSQSDNMQGKDRTRKSEEIAITPARELRKTGTVTPGDQPINEREQPASKKTRQEHKRTMEHYFGGGERVQPPSKGGTPVQSILLRCTTKTPVRETEPVNAAESRPPPEHGDKGGERAETETDTVVDLEGFLPGVCLKGKGSKKKDTKMSKEKAITEQVNKTKARKSRIAFGPTEVADDSPPAYKECVVGFAIRVDKGNNTKLAFDKKLMEGLEFIQQYVDKRAC